MKRVTENIGIALVLSLAALTGAHAASLNSLGQPVSNKFVTTSAVLPLVSPPHVSSTPSITGAGLPAIMPSQVSSTSTGVSLKSTAIGAIPGISAGNVTAMGGAQGTWVPGLGLPRLTALSLQTQSLGSTIGIQLPLTQAGVSLKSTAIGAIPGIGIPGNVPGISAGNVTVMGGALGTLTPVAPTPGITLISYVTGLPCSGTSCGPGPFVPVYTGTNTFIGGSANFIPGAVPPGITLVSVANGMPCNNGGCGRLGYEAIFTASGKPFPKPGPIQEP